METFYFRACGRIATSKTCPHDSSQHVSTSQTKIREMLKDGKKPPTEILRPEVAEVLSGRDLFVGYVYADDEPYGIKKTISVTGYVIRHLTVDSRNSALLSTLYAKSQSI